MDDEQIIEEYGPSAHEVFTFEAKTADLPALFRRIADWLEENETWNYPEHFVHWFNDEFGTHGFDLVCQVRILDAPDDSDALEVEES